MDSAGASTLEMVAETVAHLSRNIEIKVGFHSHNNLGLAVATSLIAIQNGALIIDGTLRGFLFPNTSNGVNYSFAQHHDIVCHQNAKVSI